MHLLILLVLCLSLRGSAFHLPFPPSSLVCTSVTRVLSALKDETVSATSTTYEALKGNIKHDNTHTAHARVNPTTTTVQINPEQYLSRGVDEDFAKKSFKLDNYGPEVEIGNKKVRAGGFRGV